MGAITVSYDVVYRSTAF